MTAAVITPTSGIVTNVIVAEASSDYPPLGSILIDVPDDTPVQAGYTWDNINGFVSN